MKKAFLLCVCLILIAAMALPAGSTPSLAAGLVAHGNDNPDGAVDREGALDSYIAGFYQGIVLDPLSAGNFKDWESLDGLTWELHGVAGTGNDNSEYGDTYTFVLCALRNELSGQEDLVGKDGLYALFYGDENGIPVYLDFYKDAAENEGSQDGTGDGAGTGIGDDADARIAAGEAPDAIVNANAQGDSVRIVYKENGVAKTVEVTLELSGSHEGKTGERGVRACVMAIGDETPPDIQYVWIPENYLIREPEEPETMETEEPPAADAEDESQQEEEPEQKESYINEQLLTATLEEIYGRSGLRDYTKEESVNIILSASFDEKTGLWVLNEDVDPKIVPVSYKMIDTSQNNLVIIGFVVLMTATLCSLVLSVFLIKRRSGRQN